MPKLIHEAVFVWIYLEKDVSENKLQVITGNIFDKNWLINIKLCLKETT